VPRISAALPGTGATFNNVIADNFGGVRAFRSAGWRADEAIEK
jgi:hypothetical protein